MSDTETISVAATAATAASSKAKRSERIVLDANRNEQDDWVDARGISYTSLADDYELTFMFDELPIESQRGLMAFGGVTLAGNVTNTIRNGQNKSGAQTEKEALISLFENLKAGNWTSPRGEVEAGLSLLAEAYSNAMQLAGHDLSVEAAHEKLKAADKDQRKAVRAHAQVKAELTRLIAERAAAKAKDSPAAELPML